MIVDSAMLSHFPLAVPWKEELESTDHKYLLGLSQVRTERTNLKLGIFLFLFLQEDTSMPLRRIANKNPKHGKDGT